MLRLQGNSLRVKSTFRTDCNRTMNYSKCMLCSELGIKNSYEVNALVFSYHGHFYMLTSNLAFRFYMTSNLNH